MPAWRITEESGSPELDDFLEAAWSNYHATQGHDPAKSWETLPLKLVHRDAAGELYGAATGRFQAGVGHLSELMVRSNAREGGLGSALLAEFERRCWEAGCHKITLHTEAEGPARRFYEQRGWQAEALYRRDYMGSDYVRLVRFRAGDKAEGEGAT